MLHFTRREGGSPVEEPRMQVERCVDIFCGRNVDPARRCGVGEEPSDCVRFEVVRGRCELRPVPEEAVRASVGAQLNDRRLNMSQTEG